MSNQDEMAARLKELDRRARRISALEAALNDRVNCEQCHGTGTVYVQDGPDDAHGEPCDCDITAQQVLAAAGGGGVSILGEKERLREAFEELVEASIANLEACPNGDFCNDVTRVWSRLLEARAALKEEAN